MANMWIQLSQDRLLTTAEIFYYFPDYPALLQQYVWQDYDSAPQFQKLRQFMSFWQTHLDGKLHSVRIAQVGHVSAGEWRAIDSLLM